MGEGGEERRKRETWSGTEIEDRKRHKSDGRKRKDRNRRVTGRGPGWMEGEGLGGYWAGRGVRNEEGEEEEERERVSSQPLPGTQRCGMSYSPETWI